MSKILSLAERTVIRERADRMLADGVQSMKEIDNILAQEFGISAITVRRVRNFAHKRQEKLTPDHAETLLSYCRSNVETQVIRTFSTGLTLQQTADDLGLDLSQVRNVLHRVKSRAALQGFSPEHDMFHQAPETHFVKGVSTLYKDNQVLMQWVKTDKKDEDLARKLRELVDALKEDVPQAAAKLPSSIEYSENLLAVYPMGDPHFGALAWKPEAGADFDIKIAERNLCAAVDHLVKSAPHCKYALVASVGDAFHSDNKHAHTTNSSHTLDMDSRYGKVLTVGVRAFRQSIDSALGHHEHVTVACALGNHDWHTSMFLSIVLKHIYENEPRVTVLDSFAPRIYYRFYNNLFGITHGENVKAENLPLLMANERANDWGETQNRFFLTGHVHHTSVKEFPGCVVETFNTLAARDAWHAEKGYLSERNMKAIIIHKDFGEVGRNTVSVRMLEEVHYLKQ